MTDAVSSVLGVAGESETHRDSEAESERLICCVTVGVGLFSVTDAVSSTVTVGVRLTEVVAVDIAEALADKEEETDSFGHCTDEFRHIRRTAE